MLAPTPVHVLIIEEAVADAELMVAELRRAGFGPDWRRVVTEAEYVDLLGPGLDVILADYRLPSFSAGRALEILRERELRVPFIVVSGTIGEEAAVALMKQGASDCLLKDRLARLGPAVSQALEQRRLRAAEHKAQAEVLYQSEKLGAMGQLLAGLAHELFNLLSVVIGHAKMLPRTAPPKIADRTAKLSSAAERCRRIVKNFLALARQHSTQRQQVDVNGVVREAVELLENPLRVDSVTVGQNLGGDLPMLWGDADQLHQVVVNLMTNAQQAMRGSAHPRRLTITTGHQGQRITLEVTDTGPGIPAEIRARIFEPFFTTKPPGHGTGLGLALCQSIVERHRGVISVKSAPGQGATFRVEIPAGAPSEEVESVMRPEASRSARLYRILVVDDEPDVADLLTEMLTEDGHDVDTATNGAVALEKIRVHSYDIVFCDMRMPGLDGPALYQQVEHSRPDLVNRWIFFTGDALGAETAAFLDRTRALTLAKPFDPDELRRVVVQVTAHDWRS